MLEKQISREELETKLKTWLIEDESEYNKVAQEYADARAYFEDEQKPHNIPADKQYIQENIITDLVFRLIGQMIGNRMIPVLKGGGRGSGYVQELFLDILDQNRFKKGKSESIINYFYVEGLSGIKVNFNPFIKTKYGLGMPEIFELRPGTLLLDANSIDPYHQDDMRRTHKVGMRLEDAQKKYQQYKDRITAGSEETRRETGQAYVDLYEIQYKEYEYITGEDGVLLEKENVFICKMLNKDILVEGPVKSKYEIFSIIPVIHTPRMTTYKYPIGLVGRLKDTQDQLNVASSIILESVKASIKAPAILFGVRPSEEAQLRSQLTKPDGIGIVQSTQGKLQQIMYQPLVRPVTEWHDRTRHRFDEISGSFKPDRGDIDGGMSGKALSLLQSTSVQPEYVFKNHIEDAFTQMGWVILEMIRQYMINPFKLNRQVDGVNEELYYNDPSVPESMMENVDINTMDLSVEIEMNVSRTQDIEMNKAITMRNMGSLSLKDFIKYMYPDNWNDIYRNVVEENELLKELQQYKVAKAQFDQQIAAADGAGPIERTGLANIAQKNVPKNTM